MIQRLLLIGTQTVTLDLSPSVSLWIRQEAEAADHLQEEQSHGVQDKMYFIHLKTGHLGTSHHVPVPPEKLPLSPPPHLSSGKLWLDKR
ncbi:unnamed protein product [Lota lota]